MLEGGGKGGPNHPSWLSVGLGPSLGVPGPIGRAGRVVMCCVVFGPSRVLVRKVKGATWIGEAAMEAALGSSPRRAGLLELPIASN